jgi:hypothetical protein
MPSSGGVATRGDRVGSDALLVRGSGCESWWGPHAGHSRTPRKTYSDASRASVPEAPRRDRSSVNV